MSELKRFTPMELEHLRVKQLTEREECRAGIRAILARRPMDAHALIVAELHSDESDLYTDYHGSSVTRRVAIGWRSGKREDFRQLRRAAARFPETAHYGPGKDRYRVHVVYAEEGATDSGREVRKGEYLPDVWFDGLAGERFSTREDAQQAILVWEELNHKIDAMCGLRIEPRIECDSIEHRENYSMGGGNYLADSRYSGWKVRSYGLPERGSEDLGGLDGYRIEDRISVEAPPTREPAPAGVTARLNVERHGVEILFPGKPDLNTRDKLKFAGFKWSGARGLWWAPQRRATLDLARELAGADLTGTPAEYAPDTDLLYEDQCAAAVGR